MCLYVADNINMQKVMDFSRDIISQSGSFMVLTQNSFLNQEIWTNSAIREVITTLVVMLN